MTWQSDDDFPKSSQSCKLKASTWDYASSDDSISTQETMIFTLPTATVSPILYLKGLIDGKNNSWFLYLQ